MNPAKANKIVRRSTTILQFLSSGDEGYSLARARGQDALYILAEEGGGVIDEEAVADRGSSGDNWSFAAATEDGGKSFVDAEVEDARRDGLEEPRGLNEDDRGYDREKEGESAEDARDRRMRNSSEGAEKAWWAL